MNFLVTVLFIGLLVLAVKALLPLVGLLLALALCAVGVVLWLLPILIIANSDKTSGGEKVAWILAIIFLSWFAWVFYFFLAPLKPRERYRHYY